MIEAIGIAVAAVVLICVVDVLAPRVRTAPPLILVLVGIGLSLIPAMPEIELEPELVLEVILPPLLYATAVNMPAMSFRRELGAISRLAVGLVVVSSLVLGALFAVLIPDLGFVWGAALGAILSPTDAVATSIFKGGRVPSRVVTILEGESLLNDATALVMLRTAIVAAAGTFSFWGAVGSFAYSVVVAVAIGAAVGVLNLAVRSRIASATVNTILSFTLPFIATVPAELLESSGLVAAVVAGLVTGFRGPRALPAQHRVTSNVTWSSILLVLEGAVFLTMGLQLRSVLSELGTESVGVLAGAGLAALALLVTVCVRGGIIVPLLWRQSRRLARREAMQPRIERLQRKIENGETLHRLRGPGARRERRPIGDRDLERFSTRLRRLAADFGYFSDQPLGRREGVVLVWAGMRGAVTVAAAQTLPAHTPHRALAVFIAFAVATLSLLIQGGTVGMLAGRLYQPGDDPDAERHRQEQREGVLALMRTAEQHSTAGVPSSPETAESSEKQHRLRIIRAQRDAVLDARDDGIFDADILEHALANLDAAEIAIDMRGGPEG